MKEQIITVTNKGQLIAAVGCAMDFLGVTEITLLHRTGKTFYVFNGTGYKSYYGIKAFNQMIRKVRTAIRKTPAEYFR